ncbi:hypothetical protein [Pseudomonas sp. KU43P]|uniref:hypothetical protein n=1 Tax=Pseudomonas sp. KU43P TaxID=2487887 RepID=UPI0012A92146|nr:hypothetical protein [Pseudomonas sp. KU43P]BBH43837.1 hypothetical protein KU43P_03140 [Pseudomonas sp. KU43P]
MILWSPKMLWLIAALLAIAALVVREARYRASPMPLANDAVVVAPAPQQKPFAADALRLAFGFQPANEPQARELTLKLKASFVSSRGEARALVAGSQGEAIYRIGDRLPDASVLRRVDNQSITVWLDGREHRVPLAASQPSLLVPTASSSAGRPVSTLDTRLLREVP